VNEEGTQIIADIKITSKAVLGARDVTVTTPLGTSAALIGGFTIASKIKSFTPTSGIAGTSVTINGANFSGATSVSFGETPAASFVVNSGTKITAVVGSGSTGVISVVTPDGISASTKTFTYYGSPTINSFTPDSGGKGTSVTITGTNFSGATAVKFGNTKATSFKVNSATQITAKLGSGSTGQIAVTTRGGSTTSTNSFTYYPVPKISSFTPGSGGSDTSITIIGTNFNGATTVKIGKTTASSFIVNSNTRITAIVGSGATGKISVTTPGGTDTSSKGFTYYSMPTISSFTPEWAGEGTWVTIKGSHFTKTSEVTFCGVPAQKYTIKSDTQIVAQVGNITGEATSQQGTMGSEAQVVSEVDNGISGAVNITALGGSVSKNGFTFTRFSGPNGGDIWAIGSTQYVTWTSSGITGDVKIVLSRDAGTTWEALAITPDDGSERIVVTGPAALARLKITSANNPKVGDITSSNFYIVSDPEVPELWQFNIYGNNLAKLKSFEKSGTENKAYDTSNSSLTRLKFKGYGNTFTLNDNAKCNSAIISGQTTNYTQFAHDNSDAGECVAAVLALSQATDIKEYLVTNWHQGNNVMNGYVQPGTIIATFDENGKYDGHVAIFKNYRADWSGFEVWDQNWDNGNHNQYDANNIFIGRTKEGTFGKHNITSGDTNVENANKYYIVMVE
jgi:hypothetical protein